MSKDELDETEAAEIGYGKPPQATRFQPGASGNPKGRPRGAQGRAKIARRVLLEKRKIDLFKNGKPRLYTVLEIVVLLLKKRALDGDQKAYNMFMSLEQRYGRQEAQSTAGYLIVPETLTKEEWLAKYQPKSICPLKK